MIYDLKWSLFIEISIRVVLWCIFLWIEHTEPFIREISEGEVWKYKYPVTPSYVTPTALWMTITFIPLIFFTTEYFLTKKSDETALAGLAVTLAYCLNGFITTYLKIIVGRPRPDFYYRCFPDGKGTDYRNCNGIRKSYMDGRKSFPSGHSSFSFTCMVFMSLYITRKFNLYQGNIKGQSWQLCICIVPLIIAATIAVSRTCDYHHHYEDIIAGGLIGTVVSYLCFKLYFPKSITSVD
ncbi:phospholipid phosphatase 5 [Tribolium madens]|uniref:phospholipid phosphatase 5 n=1 Tax=Tribolium madens TaxID=41895 RepID=UPI001CF74141|nr:phospholipid phosphatase 5 [Tribolium madens]